MGNRYKGKNHDWLTDELKVEVKQVFEPRYGRKLQDKEILAIADSLAGFVETYRKYLLNKENEAQRM